MKVFIVFAALCAAALASEEYCYDDVVRACKTTNKLSPSPVNCTAKYGAIDSVEEGLQRYVNQHFTRSFEYLLMSTHYANYEKNRAGFQKLFRGLADETWHDAIELIQYITKRGGEMNFHIDVPVEDSRYEIYELYSVAKALDIHKKLAVESHKLHSEATRKNSKYHDPEISSHLEHEFMPKHRDLIRKLAGYTSDLSSLLKGADSSLALYLFDEYLLKQ